MKADINNFKVGDSVGIFWARKVDVSRRYWLALTRAMNGPLSERGGHIYAKHYVSHSLVLKRLDDTPVWSILE